MKNLSSHFLKSIERKSYTFNKINSLFSLLFLTLVLSLTLPLAASASEENLPPATLVFDDMEHGNPFGNGWFTFGGSVGGGGIGPNVQVPPMDGGVFSLETGWGSGGVPGFFGGFGRTNLLDLLGMTHFNFWINPDGVDGLGRNQDYTIEINLQEDDNGDDAIPFPPDGNDDEFQYNLVISPTGPGAIAGGGWQLVSIPLADFFDDNSFLFGGNGVLDAVSTGNGGNGQLINVVFAIISNNGADVTFRTDYWFFSNFDPTLPPPDVVATKTDVELIGNLDGIADQGETYQYTVTISNADMVQGAMDVVFASGVDPNSTLVVGSVTTSQGSVTTGNTTGDATVAVDIGTLASNGSITITYDVLVDIQNPGTELTCQGSVTGSNFSTVNTDDPDTPAPDDATLTPLTPPDVSFTKTAMHIDGNGDGIVNAGEVIQFTLIVSNAPNVSTALGVNVVTPVDPNTVVNGWSTTQGTGMAGMSDITFNLGDINSGSSATMVIDFGVTFGGTGGSIVCQATASGSNFPDVLSDDPAIPGDTDPTIIGIPTLSHWGIICLSILLMIGGLLAFKRREKYAF
ncbi:MAG: IPTL-CTERM sorting domain-containing protein [Saprospiraceae bacterium]|nr:IPTL-CTERM sorting domain-containing protein [Saprospiraceae bacterium]